MWNGYMMGQKRGGKKEGKKKNKVTILSMKHYNTHLHIYTKAVRSRGTMGSRYSNRTVL